MRTFARRSSMLALAGVLAFAGAACGDDEPATDVDVTEPAEGDTTVEEETTTEMETEMETTEESTDGATEDMGTETGTETATE